MKRRKEGRLAGLLCVLLGVLLLSIQAAAVSNSLILNYPNDGVPFAVYRVADRTPDGVYTLTGEFEDYSVSIPGGSWLDTAATLAAYAARDQIKAAATESTSGGSATFTVLDAGLYLVVGASSASGSYTYTPVPFLVEIAGAEAVTVHVKYDRDDGGDGGDPHTSYKVEKVWEGDEESFRPRSVTVQLLRNGKVYESAVLDESNDWTHTWNGLNTGYRWQVTEADVPEGYTVSVSRSGRSFTVTNTWKTPADPTDPVDPVDPVDPTDPVDPVDPVDPNDPGGPDDPSLPQTGQLWWPVILLLCCGAGLLCSGCIMAGKGGGKDET